MPTLDVSALVDSAGTRDVNPGNDPWQMRQRLIACIDHQTQTVGVEVENDVPGGAFAASSIALCDVPGNLEPAALRMLAKWLLAREDRLPQTMAELLDSPAPQELADMIGEEVAEWLDDHAGNLPARIDAADWCAEGIHDDVLTCGDVNEIVARIEGGTDHTLRGTREFVTGWIEDQLGEYDADVMDDITAGEADHYRRVLA